MKICGRRLDARQIKAAFTLIELMMVLVVVAVLAGLAISVSKYAAWRAARAQQEAFVEQIRSALEEYRAVNGEYPIIGDTRHYPRNYQTPEFTSGNSPWRTLALASNVVENMSGMYSVDYSLTYPLMIGPLVKGRQPFMLFPSKVICALSYKGLMDATPRSEAAADGSVRYFWPTHSISRYKAIDPISGRQFKYVCSNGISYMIQTNNFP